MKSYKVRIRLPNGNFTDVTVQAANASLAKMVAEAQYGRDKVIAILGS
jgi:hypothetical protein